MTKIIIAIVPEGESQSKETIEIAVKHLPRIGDTIYLEDKLGLVGEYEVFKFRHEDNWLAEEKEWTDKDITPTVFVRPVGPHFGRWS